MLDLLLGTRRLRREIDTQAQQLEHDIESVKLATAQLRHTAVKRMTSPLGLFSATATGFIAGKVAASQSRAKQRGKLAIGSIAALALSAGRSLGMQLFVPIAIDWVQSKFTQLRDTRKQKDTKKQQDKKAATAAPAPGDNAPKNS